MSLSLWNRGGIFYARGRLTLADGRKIDVNRSTGIAALPALRKEAEKARQRILLEAMRGDRARVPRGGVDPEDATVQDAVDLYLGRPVLPGRSTIVCARSWARSQGGRRLRDLTLEEIEAWALAAPRLGRTGGRPMSSTVATRMKVARAVLNVARAKAWHMADLKIRAGSGRRSTDKYLAPADRDRLIACVDEHWRPYVTALFLCGGRTVEVARVRWQDVRPPTRHQKMGRIMLRHRKGGHGSRELEWVVRAVPMAPRIVEVLPTTAGLPEDYVFRDEDGDPLVDRTPFLLFTRKGHEQLRAAFRRAAETAGLARVTPGWARHTVASIIVEETGSLTLAAAMLGHTSTKMVDAFYKHLAPDALENAVGLLEEREQAMEVEE